MWNPILALLFLAVPASAQGEIFRADFENGLAGWTATGLWNPEDASETCAIPILPFPSGTGAAYFGIDSACNYDAYPAIAQGELSCDTWIDLPAGAASITLRFWSSSHTEYCWGGYDIHSIWIDVEGGASVRAPYCDGVPDWILNTGVPWHERRVDITSLAGSRVRPRFTFESGDGETDNFRGWFLDDVSVLVEPGVRVCPSTGFVTGCPCDFVRWVPNAGGCINSTYKSAVVLTSGSPTISADTLTLRARNMPPNASCLLTQAAGSSSPVPFGDGLRCVSGQLRRMGALMAQNGAASWPPPGTDSISVRGGVPAQGGTRYYYVYFRDVLPYCTSATYNLTDMQRIVWAP